MCKELSENLRTLGEQLSVAQIHSHCVNITAAHQWSCLKLQTKPCLSSSLPESLSHKCNVLRGTLRLPSSLPLPCPPTFMTLFEPTGLVRAAQVRSCLLAIGNSRLVTPLKKVTPFPGLVQVCIVTVPLITNTCVWAITVFTIHLLLCYLLFFPPPLPRCWAWERMR